MAEAHWANAAFVFQDASEVAIEGLRIRWPEFRVRDLHVFESRFLEEPDHNPIQICDQDWFRDEIVEALDEALLALFLRNAGGDRDQGQPPVRPQTTRIMFRWMKPIDAVYRVGLAMSSELRCTSKETPAAGAGEYAANSDPNLIVRFHQTSSPLAEQISKPFALTPSCLWKHLYCRRCVRHHAPFSRGRRHRTVLC